jgi:endoglucanase
MLGASVGTVSWQDRIMYRFACLLALACLLGSDAGRAQTDDGAVREADTVTALAKAPWTKGLKVGPNGPIPAIVVDQFGYPTRARKIAVIRNPQVGYDTNAPFTPGSTYAVLELSTGKVIKKAAPTAWRGGRPDPVSGDSAWWFDFSDVVTPGRYAVIDLEKGVRSASFAIGDDVYREVMKHAVRVFFYQRAGFEKKPEFAGRSWSDRASHLGPGQDGETRPWHKGNPNTLVAPSEVKDLRGGWYDAGDFNKYTTWTANYILILLRAFEENPQAFKDDYGIPESGNGIPDLLDEVKWGLEWLERMQNADGSVLCVQGLGNASPPSAARQPSYYGPATTAASLRSATTFAYASKIFSARPEPGLKAYGEALAKRARAAWAWAEASPNVVYFNNDNERQPGSQGLAAGQQEMSDTDRRRAKLEAAVYLYELSGEPGLKAFIEANFRSILPNGPTVWEVQWQDLLLYYARLPGTSPDVRKEILARFLAVMRPSVQVFESVLDNTDPYRSPIQAYTWGSNKVKAMQARLLQLVAKHGQDDELGAKALAAAMGYAHSIHGVNPLGLVYLTNMGSVGASHSAVTMFHAWFAHGTRWQRVSATSPGPPPGFLVGGPNPQFNTDGCCRAQPGSPAYGCYGASVFPQCRRALMPPKAQPPAKSYLQFNDPWPTNSWEVSEPQMEYQVLYIRLLASFVR